MKITDCTLCPNLCHADRTKAPGLCHMGAKPRICRIARHAWEEPIISGTNGSGTVFFAGCSLACVFCQNYEISHRAVGRIYSEDALINEMQRLVAEGAHNINFVNPTHYAHIIKAVLTKYRPPVPVVYNSGGYDRVETLRALEGLIDIYLPDLKYLSPALAKQYSGREDYPTVACRALDEMFRQVGPAQVESGLMKRGMLVRHLVLPGQSTEGVTVMEYLAKRYGDGIYISAMSQYLPHGEAEKHPEINRRLKPIEYKRVVAALKRQGVRNCFVQDIESSSEAYIPTFSTDE